SPPGRPMARRRTRSSAQPPPHRPHAFPACPPAAPAGRRAPCALRGHGVERRVLGWPWLSVPRPHQIRTVGAGRTAVIIAVRPVACRGLPQLVASYEAETSSSSTVAVT